MKITKTQLRNIIKEELNTILKEGINVFDSRLSTEDDPDARPDYRGGEQWFDQDYFVPKKDRLPMDQEEEDARNAWYKANRGKPEAYKFPGDYPGTKPFEYGGRVYGGKG